MSKEQVACPVETTLALLGNKWKVLILRELFTGTKRFGELSRGVPGISQKMLTQQLRQMEQDNLVQRKVYAEVPPRVEYSLTEVGRSLSPILDAMHKWGTKYRMLNGKKGMGRKKEGIACEAKEEVA
jgi:DNA-binding HxlR family transcriptional regulator